jgi:hypothetical protein
MMIQNAEATGAGGSAAACAEGQADPESASRAKIRALLQRLETASPYESGSIAEEVQRESSRLRSLTQSRQHVGV